MWIVIWSDIFDAIYVVRYAGCLSLLISDHASPMLSCKPFLSFSRGYLQRFVYNADSLYYGLLWGCQNILFQKVRLQSCGFCLKLYECFGDWQGRKLLVIGTSSLVGVLESMSLLDAFNVHLNVPKLKPADMKQVNFYWPQMLQVASTDYFCSDRILMYLPIVICNFWTSRIYFSHTSVETYGTFGMNITCSWCTRIFEILCN